MQSPRPTTVSMPLIRMSLVNPFVAELERRGFDSQPILQKVGFPAARPASNELFVAARSMYRFVHLAAETADDSYLGARVGMALDPMTLPQYAAASPRSVSLGDLLTRIAINSEHHNTSVRMSIAIDSRWASFNFIRSFQPNTDSSQIDAYYVGALVSVMMAALGDTWNPEQVIATLHRPDRIPPDFEAIGLATNDGDSVSIAFPSLWLFEPTIRPEIVHNNTDTKQYSAPPVTLEDSLKAALRPHIHEQKLTVERSAELCGFEKRQLARKLKARGTTIARLIATIREERATQALAETDRRVSDIAGLVGFKDPAVFSRAFKNWTGQSPQEYRRTHR